MELFGRSEVCDELSSFQSFFRFARVEKKTESFWGKEEYCDRTCVWHNLLNGMEDGRVSLAEIFEVRASGFNSAELLAVLSGATECLLSKKVGIKGLFSPETLFITENGKVQIEICDTINPDFIPPETMQNPKEPLFDHQLVWCLGKIAQNISLPTSNDAGLFSLINLMTVEHVATRPNLQKLNQMIKNKLANPEAVSKTLKLMFEEVMGNIEELADESDEENYISPPIIPMSYSKKAELTQHSSPSSSVASDSSNDHGIPQSNNFSQNNGFQPVLSTENNSFTTIQHSYTQEYTVRPDNSKGHYDEDYDHKGHKNEGYGAYQKDQHEEYRQESKTTRINQEEHQVQHTDHGVSHNHYYDYGHQEQHIDFGTDDNAYGNHVNEDLDTSVTNVFKYGGKPVQNGDKLAFDYADDVDEHDEWVNVNKNDVSGPAGVVSIQKQPVTATASETLSRISEESTSLRNSVVDQKVATPEMESRNIQKPETTGRFLKKSEIQNKYISHKPSGSVEIVAAEVHKDYSRDSSPSASLESEATSENSYRRQNIENQKPQPEITSLDQTDKIVKPLGSPVINQNLVRHNSLKPSKIHRQSTNRQVNTFATPEFLEKKSYPIIRLRAQSQKRRRVALHRVEETFLFVKLLNGQKVELNCRSDALVGNIFDTVVAHLNLSENSFFGLAILEDNEYFFLENEQRLEKFAPSGWRLALKTGSRYSFMLFLRFKFYPKRNDFVKTAQASHNLYIQLRQNILDGTLQLNRNQLLEAGSFALQAEFGDKPDHVNNYFELDGYIPKSMLARMKPEDTHNLKDAILRLHATKKSLRSKESEAEFIELCQSLPTYGAHFYLVHKFKPSNKNPVDARFRAHQWVVIMPQGIGIAKETQIGTKQINSVHEWHMIRTLQYDGKRFLLATMENNIAVDHVFYLEHFTKSRYLVKFAAEQHKFMLRMRQWQSTLLRNKVTGNQDVMVERGVDEVDHREEAEHEQTEWNDMTLWTDQFIEQTYGSDAQKLEIILEKDPVNGLGLTLVDGSVNGVKGVYVKSVAENGDGKRKGLHMGDCILSINNVSLWNRTRHDAVTLVKQCESHVRIQFLRFHSITAVLLSEGPEKFKESKPEEATRKSPESPKKSVDSMTLGRMARTPPLEKKEVLNRRQRAVSDFGVVSDTLPTLNSEDLLKSMEQLSRSRKRIESSSESEEEETSFMNKGVYNPPVSDMYAFHRNSDDEDVNRDIEPTTSKQKSSYDYSNASYVDERKESRPKLPKQKTLDWTNEVQAHESEDEEDDQKYITVELVRAPARSLGFRIASSNGVVRIKQITSEPASQADLKENDRLISINGKELSGLAHQDVVNLLRNGGTVITLKIGRSEEEEGERITVTFQKAKREDLGISWAKRAGADGTYIRSITFGSLAESEGTLRMGDIVMTVNNLDVTSQLPKELIEHIKDIEGEVRITVRRSLQ
ncbi:unnamed protein product [Bursaphelenchus okinawaensis]|uniref:PDZ domain-containing protein n=1 Tax=Bursaphelenchus okinawaensis TaxID=465554 RepID=A0A811JS71_9BILA|nr:unnamed protein product [Bursaphelenchus okinawaensis]CAG9080651.1 unnamed protein product [Bursaphelenchus okinawaensis]